MTSNSREDQLIDTFVTLADTMVLGYDVIDLLHTLIDRCRDTLDVEAAGILLANTNRQLELVASTSEASELVEIMQVDAQEGPCMDCFTTGRPVPVPNVEEDAGRWPRFRNEARKQGFLGVFALPLRLRDTVIGTLNLMRTKAGEMTDQDLRAAQALADIATIGILHERVLTESDTVRRQLQGALQTRVVIEQAKGFVAHTNGISTDEAFRVLRKYARERNKHLTDVARGVLSGTVAV